MVRLRRPEVMIGAVPAECSNTRVGFLMGNGLAAIVARVETYSDTVKNVQNVARLSSFYLIRMALLLSAKDEN